MYYKWEYERYEDEARQKKMQAQGYMGSDYLKYSSLMSEARVAQSIADSNKRQYEAYERRAKYEDKFFYDMYRSNTPQYSERRYIYVDYQGILHDSPAPTGFTYTIWQAAEAGLVYWVKSMLNPGNANIDNKDSHGNTPLLLAASNAHHLLVIFLLENGAKVNIKNNSGLTAFLLSASKGHLTIVKRLLGYDLSVLMDINMQGEDAIILANNNGHSAVASFLGGIKKYHESKTMLFDLVANNQVESMDWLFDYAGLKNINETNEKGETPLLVAAAHGCDKMIAWLLDKGAKIYEGNKDGDTPLLLATVHGDLSIVQFLAKKESSLTESNNSAHTALLLAALYGHTPIAKWLLGQHFFLIKDKNIHQEDAIQLAKSNGHIELSDFLSKAQLYIEDNRTIFDAASLGDLEILQWFIHYAGVKIGEVNQSGQTPLLLAVMFGHKSTVQWLLNYRRLSFKLEWKELKTLLLLADHHGHKKVVQFLIEKHPDLILDNIYFAAIYGNLDWLQWLVKHSQTDLETTWSDNNSTLLITATRYKQTEIVQWLLENGAKVRQQNNGHTALLFAAFNGHVPIMQLLLEKDPSSILDKNPKGEDAITLAEKNHQQDIHNFLIKTRSQYLKENAFKHFLAQQAGAERQLIVGKLEEARLMEYISQDVVEHELYKAIYLVRVYTEKQARGLVRLGVDVNRLLQLEVECLDPLMLLNLNIVNEQAVGTHRFWQGLPPVASNHPCFEPLNELIEKIETFHKKIPEGMLTIEVKKYLKNIIEAYINFREKIISETDSIKNKKAIILSKYGYSIPFQLKSCLYQLEETPCLIVPDKEFSWYQWRWKNFPPDSEDHPCFSRIKQVIYQLQHYLSFTWSEDLRSGLINIKEYYQNYIKVVCNKEIYGLTQSFPKPVIMLKGINFPYHYLSTEAAEALLSESGNIHSNQTHVVIARKGVHYKRNPHAPGVEFLVDSLNKILLGRGSPPTQLLKVIDNQGNQHAFIASKSVAGTELQFVIVQHPEYIQKILPYSFSGMMVSGLLVNHNDGKADNFMVSYLFDEHNEISGLEIIGVDNDIAFAKPFYPKTCSGKRYPCVRNVLYFFPQMDAPFDGQLCQELLEKNPEMLIIEWIFAILQKNCEYRQLLDEGAFVQEEFTGISDIFYNSSTSDPSLKQKIAEGCPYEVIKKNKRGLQLPIQFLPNTVVDIYHTFKKIQSLLRSRNDLTHNQLLAAIQPKLFRYYQATKLRFNQNINDCEVSLYKELGNSLASVCKGIDISALERSIACGDMGECTSIAIFAAELLGFEKRDSCIEAEAEHFIAAIDFSDMEENIEQLLLQNIQKLNFIKHLTLKGVKTLTDLIKYLDPAFLSLEIFSLTHTKNITLTAVQALAQYPKPKCKLVIDIHCEPLSAQDWILLAKEKRCPLLLYQTEQFDLHHYYDRPHVLLSKMIRHGLYNEKMLDILMLMFTKNEMNINISFINKGTFLHEVAEQNHAFGGFLCDYLCNHGIAINIRNDKEETALDIVLERLKTANTDLKRNLYPLLTAMVHHKIPTNRYSYEQVRLQLKTLSEEFRPSPLANFFQENKTSAKGKLSIGYQIFGFLGRKNQAQLMAVNHEIRSSCQGFALN